MEENDNIGTPQQETEKLMVLITARETIAKVPSVSIEDKGEALKPIINMASSSPYFCVRIKAQEYMRNEMNIVVHPNKELGLSCVH